MKPSWFAEQLSLSLVFWVGRSGGCAGRSAVVPQGPTVEHHDHDGHERADAARCADRSEHLGPRRTRRAATSTRSSTREPARRGKRTWASFPRTRTTVGHTAVEVQRPRYTTGADEGHSARSHRSSGDKETGFASSKRRTRLALARAGAVKAITENQTVADSVCSARARHAPVETPAHGGATHGRSPSPVGDEPRRADHADRRPRIPTGTLEDDTRAGRCECEVPTRAGPGGRHNSPGRRGSSGNPNSPFWHSESSHRGGGSLIPAAGMTRSD